MGVACATLISPAEGFADDGVRTESLQFHPGIALGAGFNTNVFRLAPDEGRSDIPRGAPHLSIVPELVIESHKEADTRFSFDASAAWRQYISSNRGIRKQTGFSTEAGLETEFNRDGEVGFTIREYIERLNEPAYAPNGEPINRIWNKLGFQLDLRPGARLLNASIGYDWNLFFYQSDQLNNLNKNLHEIAFETNWQFLPETALVVLLDYSIIRYFTEERREDVSNPGSVALKNTNSSPLRIQGGTRTKITPQISVTLVGGYGASHYEEGDNFEGPMGRGSLTYEFGRPDLDNRISLGYRRDFSDATLGNYYHYHRMFGRYQQEFVDGRLQLTIEGRIQPTVYPDIDATAAQTPDSPFVGLPSTLNDVLVGGESVLEWKIARWGSLRGSYQFQANFTSSDVAVAGTGTEQPGRRFRQHVIQLSTVFRY